MVNNSIKWLTKIFDDLSPRELYAIIQLRNEVFVVEQNCVFQDADNQDQQCLHLMGWNEEQLVAYSRISAPGVMYTEAGIGRVVTLRSMRGKGLGIDLMHKTIEETYRLYGKSPIKLGAQLYLRHFYSRLGFIPDGEIYLEDGIEHLYMTLPVTHS